MAWLQSHQELRSHPKTRKAARLAGCSIPTMIGHLHLLWWWALDHAPDGDLSRFDSLDLADAAGWEDDPATFLAALVDCGPGDMSGFVDSDRCLHDWEEYGGKYGKRVAAAKKAARARWDNADVDRSDTAENATAMRPHNERNASRNAEERRGEEKDQTPASTDVDRADTSEHSEVDTVAEHFELFWQQYPKRNGKKIGKANSLIEWRKLSIGERRRAYLGAKHIAVADTLPKDPERFLRKAKGGKGGFPFDDWQEPEVTDGGDFFAGVAV